MNTTTILRGDALAMLRTLPDESVHCGVTSPPYLGLRDYGVDGQIGLEETPEQYVARLVDVFREVRRVLRRDGTLWLNIGDSYNGSGTIGRNDDETMPRPKGGHKVGTSTPGKQGQRQSIDTLKPKDLIGVPWRLAFALQADGWWLRSDVIWHKPNPMPESVTDRPTKAHEYLFLLTKAERYFYDAQAIAEAAASEPQYRDKMAEGYHADYPNGDRFSVGGRIWGNGTRNRRSVWTVATEPTPYAHFATMPTALVEPCVMAGTSAHGVCPACGAPWARVVEKAPYNPPPAGDGERNVDASRGDKNRKLNGKSAEFRESAASATTTGWTPTCACRAGAPVPATVLDPFAGSGTTLRVAIGLGRSAIGIELNPEYAALAERLLAQTQPALMGV